MSLTVDKKEIKDEIKPNEKQQECIDKINGFYMVLAGPGTGKTFTLTRRIRSMIEKNNISPEEIICLTYSDTAANEMKSKLINLLGNCAVNVHISTFHSFCNEIIQYYPEKFDFQGDVKLIDAVSQEVILKKCLDDAYEEGIDLSLITNEKTGSYYGCQDSLLNIVSDMKKYRVSKEQLLHNIEKNEQWQPQLDDLITKRDETISAAKAAGKQPKIITVEKNIEKLKNKIDKAKLLIELAERYKLLMVKYNYIDFNDMVSSVIDVTEFDTELGEDVFSKFKYVLVDEYQDTNTVQNILIDRIIQYSENCNVFVVGDDDQIIYGFQGASLNNCENFLRKYPQTEVICLTENNRSTQTILDFARQVISQDLKRLEKNPEFAKYNITKTLTAENEKVTVSDKKIKYTVYNEKLNENLAIVEQIKEIISNLKPDEKLSDIAVLARKHKQLDELVSLLENENIPYQRKTKKSIFEIPASLMLYSYLKLLNNPKTSVDKQFSILMQEPFKLDEEDYLYILSQNRPVWKDFISIMEENKDYKWKNPQKINQFLETYKKLNDLKFKKSLKNLLIHVANESGILAYFANSRIDAEENILAIKRLIVEAATYKTIYISNFLDNEIVPGPYLNHFLNYLDKCYKSDAAPKIEETDDILNAVQLITYHGSKGREFNHVFLPWLNNKNFEKAQPKRDFSVPVSEDSVDKEEQLLIKKSELLKLLFVGITRAKHDLRLSFSLSEEQKPKELTELLAEKLTDNPLVEMKIEQSKTVLESTIKSLTTTFVDHYEEELRERIKTIQLNAHSLQLYKSCPRAYLYSEIYKLPTEVENVNNIDFGNAIHYALKKLTKSGQSGQYMPKENVVDFALEYLKTCEFEDERTYEFYQKRCKDAIDSCYHRITDIPAKNIFEQEYKFENLFIGSMPMKGFIDLVVKNSDGTYSLYDYKTGKAKSKTSIARGKDYENYWIQLAVYKIAFEMKNKNSKVTETTLKFVEEEEGKDISVQFLSEEIENIKDEIKTVSKNILDLNFEPIDKKTAAKACSNCQYKFICFMQNSKTEN